eukprot:1734303-Heterocapsa_arctica.AAC.1
MFRVNCKRTWSKSGKEGGIYLCYRAIHISYTLVQLGNSTGIRNAANSVYTLPLLGSSLKSPRTGES